MTGDYEKSVPSNDVVLAAVQRISASPEFDKADRLKAFLEFVVSEQLSGRADTIKEYLIGVEVYGKPDFDPRMDASVRVGAGKLRSRLEQYYAGTGKGDPTVICIPKGTYIPQVHQRSPPLSMEKNLKEFGWPHWQTGVGLVLVPVMLFVGVAFSRRPEARQLAEHRRIQLTTDLGVESHPSFSPAGTQFAFSANIEEPGNFDIYIKDIDSQRVFRLTSDQAADSNPVWSPDGRTIAFNRNQGYGGQVFLVGTTGGIERELAHVNLGGLAWTADSRYVAAHHRGSQAERPHMVLINANTGQTKPLTKSTTLEDYSAAFSPDGKWVALVRCLSGFVCEIHLGALGPDSNVIEPTRRIATAHGAVHGVAWTGDSKAVLYSAGLYNDWNLWRVSINPLHTRPERLDSGDLSVHYPTTPFLAPSSFKVVGFETRTIDENIWIAPLPGSSPPKIGPARRLAPTPRGEWAPSPSPDGSHLVFVSDRSGSQQLWITARDGTDVRQITELPFGAVIYPRWSPNGTEIVFTYVSSGETGASREIFTVRPTPGSPLVRIAGIGNQAKDPAWSSDGKWIYHARRDVQTQLWRSSRDGRIHEQLTRFGGELPLPTPDRLYFITTGDAVWAADLDGRNQRKVLSDAHDAAWYPVHDGLIFVPRPNTTNAGKLAHWHATTGVIRLLGSLPHPDLARFTVDATETFILYSRTDIEKIDIAMIQNYDQQP